MIQAESVSFRYQNREKKALEDLSMSLKAGQLAAVLGCNGSGKSTFARLLNGLLPIQKGRIRVAGLDAEGRSQLWELRRRAGMVFQNPERQFVSSVVWEDIAFGLENYDVPEQEIPSRVRAALKQVGLEGFEERNIHTLSGGQKQRAALAGVLALRPDVLLLDEVTAMLDPEGREDVRKTLTGLREGKRHTILMITHFVEEAVEADQILLLHEGSCAAQGTPAQVLTDPALLQKAGLLPPVPVRVYWDLLKEGIQLPFIPLSEEELVEAVCRYN